MPQLNQNDNTIDNNNNVIIEISRSTLTTLGLFNDQVGSHIPCTNYNDWFELEVCIYLTVIMLKDHYVFGIWKLKKVLNLHYLC